MSSNKVLARHFRGDHVLGLFRLGWCSAQLPHHGQHVFQQLTTEISRRRQRLSPLDASQLAWSMARMEYRCEQLLWQLQGDLLHQLHHCDGRHLANTLWSFAKLSCALLQVELGAVHFQLPSEEAKWQVPRKLFAILASKNHQISFRGITCFHYFPLFSSWV